MIPILTNSEMWQNNIGGESTCVIFLPNATPDRESILISLCSDWIIQSNIRWRGPSFYAIITSDQNYLLIVIFNNIRESYGYIVMLNASLQL